MQTLAILVGSLRSASINRQLANGLAEIGPDLFKFNQLKLDEVPIFNEELEQNPPAAVVTMKQSLKAADGVLIITPEYNRSMPALVKNTLDWASRPYGDNSWTGKPVAVAGMSPGAVGTAVCQSQLRSVLGFLGARQMTQPEIYLTYAAGFFDANGNVANERTRTFLRKFLESFGTWINKNKN
ncbi:MAG: NAD(P)H-dependent oxidoreductase [Deltaproteobacteria bacterium]|jgi:chromate reductase|nr:NAD(P)H-dependent oxidoreductase [Deltaproteobacteria bacterium]